ncbi:transcription termination factor Rho [Actinospica durhamensis]|uniref:Transcription termination factor Rho n=1 Tax=Actinospica durhamensis TaxID=1508375 RepID=A0A941IVI8_9ACTN|nr:transcription termination factor Rho [Actinospica durhamensis]MBR7839443.1 transcription termination factor Rho [Actinospica durhamensis]
MTTTLDRPTAARSDRRPSRRAAADTSAAATNLSPTSSAPEDTAPHPVSGIVELQDQHGFLRVTGYLPGPRDHYISADLIRRHKLRTGDYVHGAGRAPSQSSARTSAYASAQAKASPLVSVESVNGRRTDDPDAQRERPRFAELTPLHPREQLRLETGPAEPGTRVIDLLTPIGKGQRGLIVAQPKTGKTQLLRSIAQAVERNHPECHLMVVLLDERPEEVTDMRRTVGGEVISSTFDRPAYEHIAAAELAVERAKRIAELGGDVVILLDSLTRLCRAHNNNAKPGGRTLSGGVDAAAIAKPKQLFGAARNLEEAGSITILATALVETGSRADDFFFEELKSTGNMELRLDRALAERRLFPAVDVTGSGTRREELLVSPEELDTVRRLRRVLAAQSGAQATELLLERMRHTRDNAEFLRQIRQTTPAGSTES